MTESEILSNLCYYDPRNPTGAISTGEELPDPKHKCSCDNCFYGRDKLANEILKRIDEFPPVYQSPSKPLTSTELGYLDGLTSTLKNE